MPVTTGSQFACGYTVCFLLAHVHRRPTIYHRSRQLGVFLATLSHWFAVIVSIPVTLHVGPVALLHTVDKLTPGYAANNLTTWGFYDCQRDMSNGAGGGESKCC